MKVRIKKCIRTIAEILLLPVAAIVTIIAFRRKNGR